MSTPLPPGSPAGSMGGAGALPSAARAAVRRVLRVPLLVKIVVATSAAVAVSAAVTAALFLRWTPVEVERVVGFVALPALLTAGAGGALVALLVRLALSPVRGLTAAARRVRDGEETARAPASPLADRETAELIRVFNDMLDRLEEADEIRRRLALRLAEAEESEREGLARDLYDEVAQTLAAVLVQIRAGASAAGAAPSANGESVRSALVDALEAIRRTARTLSPPELRDLGLERALEACARTLTDREGWGGEVVVSGEAGPMEPLAAHTLYRIVEASLREMAARPGAGRVEVALRGAADHVTAEVRDLRSFPAGVPSGFPPDERLHGLAERARRIGGSVDPGAGDRAGRTIRLRIPRVPTI